MVELIFQNYSINTFCEIQVEAEVETDAYLGRCRAQKEHCFWGTCTWKLRPKSGRDCLMCATLARQQRRRGRSTYDEGFALPQLQGVTWSNSCHTKPYSWLRPVKLTFLRRVVEKKKGRTTYYEGFVPLHLQGVAWPHSCQQSPNADCVRSSWLLMNDSSKGRGNTLKCLSDLHLRAKARI